MITHMLQHHHSQYNSILGHDRVIIFWIWWSATIGNFTSSLWFISKRSSIWLIQCLVATPWEIRDSLKARLHWSVSASASASVVFKYLAFHLLCLHCAKSASASFIRVRVRFFSTVHRLYMASALTRYFVKDADAEADAAADQCKRTFRDT